MEAFVKRPTNERAEVFQATADSRGIPPFVVEKDFWVCWVLNRIFQDATLSQQVIFKGGTSLSKCYRLINRMSEDIDLVLDWALLTDENPYKERSNTAQAKFNDNSKTLAKEYVAKTLVPQLNELVSEYCELSFSEKDPPSVMIAYPRVFESEYIKPEIELEVGPISAMQPCENSTIKAMVAEEYPEIIANANIVVNAISARKTFWDKITILHVEAQRGPERNQPDRYSRHYYDIYQMILAGVGDEALQDLPLLKQVLNFKRKFYPQGWARYPQALEGEIQLIPQDHLVEHLKKDYEAMEEMIYGNYPSFDNILQSIGGFEERLHEVWQVHLGDT